MGRSEVESLKVCTRFKNFSPCLPFLIASCALIFENVVQVVHVITFWLSWQVMIYLIEGVLPEGYFANNLRGLSVDMAVFRDLLRQRLPVLSRHLEALQQSDPAAIEPPLTNVFTMQWFLTVGLPIDYFDYFNFSLTLVPTLRSLPVQLFATCLPKAAVLRVWDLIFLEGNDVLLRTALAIWRTLAE